MNKIENFRGKANTNGFKENPDNSNKEGRPKKIFTILKEKGYNKTDINIAFRELQWYSLDELENLHNDSTKPIITRIVANQFIQAHKKGDWSKIKDIIEMTIGKATQKISADVSDNRERIAAIFPKIKS